MALVFDNIVRYTVVGTYAGQDCMNIIDVRLEPTVPGVGDRDDAIFDAAGDILNNWDDHVLPLLVGAYTALEVRWVDLDSASGTTGARSSTSDTTWPANGGNTGSGLPGNVYAKVAKLLQGKTREQRNGVLRLTGLAEGATEVGSPNTLTTLVVQETNTAFEDLKDGVQSQAAGWFRWLGVLHTTDNVATGWSDISQFSTASTVGTIRRRMPGYGQ